VKTIERKRCVVCQSTSLESCLTLENFPIYMGVSDENPVKINQYRKICKECGCIQLSQLIPLDILYKNPHNPAIGKTWEEHNRRFVDFSIKYCGEHIVEIGGGNGRIASLILNKKKCSYTIYDKHYSENLPSEIKRTHEFYNPSNTSSSSDKCDTIISSHVVEHLYDPKEYFKAFYERLTPKGRVVFSAPNITQGIKDKLLNTADLNFEHTYQLDEHYLEALMGSCGFQLAGIGWNNPYNMFMAFQKTTGPQKTRPLLQHYEKHKALQESYENFHLKNVDTLCKKVSGYSNKFLFGCHISSQHLLHFGLNKINFNGILDSDPAKQGKFLYGTSLKTFSPQILKNMTDVAAIVQMGIYTDEISSQLMEINPSCAIINDAGNPSLQ